MKRLSIALALLLTACGGGGLGDPVDSGVEGVPLPATATAQDGGWRVSGATFADLRAWYDEQLPEGEAFGDWAWCDLSGDAELIGRIYHRPDTTRILGVTVTDGDPPGILITVDDSGPC